MQKKKKKRPRLPVPTLLFNFILDRLWSVSPKSCSRKQTTRSEGHFRNSNYALTTGVQFDGLHTSFSFLILQWHWKACESSKPPTSFFDWFSIAIIEIMLTKIELHGAIETGWKLNYAFYQSLSRWFTWAFLVAISLEMEIQSWSQILTLTLI